MSGGAVNIPGGHSGGVGDHERGAMGGGGHPLLGEPPSLQTHEALLDALQLEHRKRVAAEEAWSDLSHQAQEMQVNYELQIDSLRVENINVKGRLTRLLRSVAADAEGNPVTDGAVAGEGGGGISLGSQAAQAELVEGYRAEIERLNVMVHDTEVRNIELEVNATERAGGGGGGWGGDGDGGEGGGGREGQTRGAAQESIRARLHELATVNANLRSENSELRSVEKSWQLHKKGFEVRSKKLNTLTSQVASLTSTSGAMREELQAARTALKKTAAEARVLRENEALLLENREQCSKEVVELRTYATMLHQGQRKRAMMHLLSSTHLNGGAASLTGNSNGQRVDQAARVKATKIVQPCREALLRLIQTGMQGWGGGSGDGGADGTEASPKIQSMLRVVEREILAVQQHIYQAAVRENDLAKVIVDLSQETDVDNDGNMCYVDGGGGGGGAPESKMGGGTLRLGDVGGGGHRSMRQGAGRAGKVRVRIVLGGCLKESAGLPYP